MLFLPLPNGSDRFAEKRHGDGRSNVGAVCTRAHLGRTLRGLGVLSTLVP